MEPETSYTLTSLEPGQTYSFQLRAVNLGEVRLTRGDPNPDGSTIT